MRRVLEHCLKPPAFKTTQHDIGGGCDIKINDIPLWPAYEIRGEQQTHGLNANVLKGFG